MGQGTSHQAPETALWQAQNKLKSQLKIISKIAKLKYDDLLQSVEELNQITSSFNDHRGKQLHFAIVKDTDATILWKHTIRIKCEKVSVRKNIVESERCLKLRHFIELYSEITEQVSNLTHQEKDSSRPTSSSLENSSELSASVIFNGAFGRDIINEDLECCICMESKPEVVLSCSHKFCEQCIDSWNVASKTCPICRARVSSTDDTWVLTEKPTDIEYETEVKGYLVGLADRKGAVS